MVLCCASNVSLSAVSICGFFQHMMKISYDVVKRWINEAQEAASNDNVMVQVCLRVVVSGSSKCTPGFSWYSVSS